MRPEHAEMLGARLLPSSYQMTFLSCPNCQTLKLLLPPIELPSITDKKQTFASI